MKLLVSAFEPFSNAKTNSSLILAENLARLNWHGDVQFHFPLSVTYSNAWNQLLQKIETDGPFDGIIALGQAETRTKISLERIALNWIDAKIADNNQHQIMNEKIDHGPDLLWSTIPWEQLELPPNCERSYSAGTFVCNHLMYQLLKWNLQHKKLAGFIHIPLTQGQEIDFSHQKTVPLNHLMDSMKLILHFILSLQPPR